MERRGEKWGKKLKKKYYREEIKNSSFITSNFIVLYLFHFFIIRDYIVTLI